MFADCFALESIDVSNFDTKKVKKMNAMFQDAQNLHQ